MNARLILWVVLAALVIPVLTAVATAAGGPGVCGYPGWGSGYYAPRLYVRDDDIPYYAKHPPVYYSYPVPRPYGYSPFAYPPGTMTPEVKVREPLMVPNRYVPRKTERRPDGDRQTRTPLRIINPYVVHSGEPNESPIPAGEQPRRPQVVFPASLP